MERIQLPRYVIVVGPQNPITFTIYGYCRKVKQTASDSGAEKMQSSTATSYVGV